jgi:hypothetical protein
VDVGTGVGTGGCGPVEEVAAGMIACSDEVVVAGAFGTGGAVPVLNVSVLLVVSMDGWEDNATLGTDTAVTEANELAAEAIA